MRQLTQAIQDRIPQLPFVPLWITGGLLSAVYQYVEYHPTAFAPFIFGGLVFGVLQWLLMP
ncbi:MAG: hypothetical protein AAF125_18095, partial [Chloroflexota bacterium]